VSRLLTVRDCDTPPFLVTVISSPAEVPMKLVAEVYSVLGGIGNSFLVCGFNTDIGAYDLPKFPDIF